MTLDPRYFDGLADDGRYVPCPYTVANKGMRAPRRSRSNCVRKLFGYSEAEATRMMLQVHNDGKAVVSSGEREKAEFDVSRLHASGLWATLRQD